MHDILDEQERCKRPPQYAVAAIVVGVLALLFFLGLMHSMSGSSNVYEATPTPPLWLVRGTQILTVAGTVFTILCLVRREYPRWLVWLASLLNGVLFVLVIGSIVLVYIMQLG